MIKKIKCEIFVYKIITLIYILYSGLYIGKNIYNKNYKKSTFPFMVSYFSFILSTYMISMKNIFNVIKKNKFNKKNKYFILLFILLCASFSMSIIYIYPDQDQYYKIVDEHTLVSSSIYQFIVIFCIYCRILTKIDNKQVIENTDNTVTQYNLINYV